MSVMTPEGHLPLSGAVSELAYQIGGDVMMERKPEVLVRIAGTIAAEIHADPHLVQTLLQEHMHALLSDVAGRLDGDPAA